MKFAQTAIAALSFAAAALTLAGCSSESQFPNPTGKGTFRAINGVSNTPVVTFRIEESVQENLAYRTGSDGRRIDDFEYNFNFDVSIPGEDDQRRIATTTQKIDADQDYTFALIGDVNSPEVVTWTSAERSFDEGATITEIRLAHLARSLGTVDVYFLADGAEPVLGTARGSYSYRDILPPFDTEAGNYSVVVTAPNDPTTVLFESNPGGYVAGSSMIVAIFDSTVDDTSAYTAQAISKTNIGTSFSMIDARALPTIQFVQGSEFIGTVDIYDDEALTNRIVTALPFGGIEPPIELPGSTNTFYYTPADSTATVLFEETFVLNPGVRHDLFTFGSDGSGFGVAEERNRQPAALYATLAANSTITTAGLELIQIYVVPPGASLEDEIPDTFTGVAVQEPPVANLAAGQYELVFALVADGVVTPLADRIPLELANGDVVRYVLFSTEDPNVINPQVLP